MEPRPSWSTIIGNQPGVGNPFRASRTIDFMRILIQQPGAYELSAKVLGHTDTDTLKIYYSGAEHNAAINHSQQLVRNSGAFGGPAVKTKAGGAF